MNLANVHAVLVSLQLCVSVNGILIIISGVGVALWQYLYYSLLVY